VGAINMERLNQVKHIIDRTKEFIDQVYIPDLLAIGSLLQGLAARRRPVGQEHAQLRRPARQGQRLQQAANLMLPRGAIIDGDLSKIHAVDVKDPEQVQEFVSHSWYRYADETKGLHPWDGVTEPHYKPEGPNFKGTAHRHRAARRIAKYSWIKAPRWRGHAMEVGPLSRMVLGYAAAQAVSVDQGDHRRGAEEARRAGDGAVQHAGPHRGARHRGAVLRRPADARIRPPGRQHQGRRQRHRQRRQVGAATWPKEAKGAGFTEAPRGALGHWVKIKDGRIDNYQCVVPTTWNGSPRDHKGQIGAFEASLMNTPLAKGDEPLEILRTLHSSTPAWPAPRT
jgi:hydrogenase large subunit